MAHSGKLKLPYRSLERTKVDDYLHLDQPQNLEAFPADVNALARSCPNYLFLSYRHWAGDLSDERIANLMRGQEKDWESNLELAFGALVHCKDPRAKDLALSQDGVACVLEDLLSKNR